MTDEISPLAPRDWLAASLDLLRRPLALPDVVPADIGVTLPVRDPARPCALLLSPHPDDECLTGGLALRLRREQGWQIVNIAVTLGSKTDQRLRRLNELRAACAVLGFDGLLPCADGFSNVKPEAKQNDTPGWPSMVARLAEIFAHYAPQAVFFPHARDADATHRGVHLLGMDALAAMPRDFTCAVVETEYWQPNEGPNLMVGLNAADAGTLLKALTCHQGEVARNPYDRRFASYLIDNVRRGSEVVGGKGAAAAPVDFAMLYRVGRWIDGKNVPSALNRIVTPADGLADIFPGDYTNRLMKPPVGVVS